MLDKFSRLSTLLPLLIFIVLTVYLWKGLALNPRELPSTLIDQAAPRFRAPTLNNPDKMVTERIFLGNITLFHVWATWCSVCRLEHSFLVELSKQKNIRLIGLNYKDQRKKALYWLEKASPYTEVVYDHSGKIGMDWGVYGTPETFVIDRQGIIRYKYTGMLTVQIWQDKFLPILKKLQHSSVSISSNAAEGYSK